MDKKTTGHPGRSKKRKFTSNQHFSEVENVELTSKSAEKLKNSNDQSFDVNTDLASHYCIISFLRVFSTLSKYVKCKICNENITFSKYGKRGLGFKICLSCACGEKHINSCPMINSSYKVNRRLVFVMRLIGIGLAGINMFCGLMDIGKGLNKKVYYQIVDGIAADAVFDLVTRKAVIEEKEIQKKKGLPEDILTVSGDGSWEKEVSLL